MKLTKTIPEHKKTAYIKWVRPKCLVMNETYRKIRSTFADKMDTCYWCGHKLENGEQVAIACIKGKGNKVLCENCVEKIEQGEKIQ